MLGGKIHGQQSGARDVIDLGQVEDEAPGSLIDGIGNRGCQLVGRRVYFSQDAEDHAVGSEHFAVTHFGRYLQQLRERTPGPIVADMFCLLRLELELAVQAKALLIAREAGVDVPVDDDLEAILAERRYLHRSIGRIGLLALKPLGSRVTGITGIGICCSSAA